MQLTRTVGKFTRYQANVLKLCTFLSLLMGAGRVCYEGADPCVRGGMKQVDLHRAQYAVNGCDHNSIIISCVYIMITFA
jgi:hypothetical protein